MIRAKRCLRRVAAFPERVVANKTPVLVAFKASRSARIVVALF
jgi:hypothetical protein